MSQLVKGVSLGTESQGVTPQQMHMSSERYSKAVLKTQVKCSQWEPVPCVCLSLLFWTRIWCSRATRIYTTIQCFLLSQNSCFAAMFGAGDRHYRYLDAKKKENKHREECWFSLHSKPCSAAMLPEKEQMPSQLAEAFTGSTWWKQVGSKVLDFFWGGRVETAERAEISFSFPCLSWVRLKFPFLPVSGEENRRLINPQNIPTDWGALVEVLALEKETQPHIGGEDKDSMVLTKELSFISHSNHNALYLPFSRLLRNSQQSSSELWTYPHQGPDVQWFPMELSPRRESHTDHKIN